MKLEKRDLCATNEEIRPPQFLILYPQPYCLCSKNVVLKYESWSSFVQSCKSKEMSLNYDSSSYTSICFQGFRSSFCYICAYDIYIYLEILSNSSLLSQRNWSFNCIQQTRQCNIRKSKI